MSQQEILDEIYAKKLQKEYDEEMQRNRMLLNDLSVNNNPDYSAIIRKTVSMSINKDVTNLCSKHGLTCSNVVWEDNARSKNSSWGPCISDMTLTVSHNGSSHQLPVIRTPNYEDLTWDAPIEGIPLLVGNEHAEKLRKTNLKEYLTNFRDYLSFPLEWPGSRRSLLADRDSHVIMSTQACFLPIPALGGESVFNVSLFNYQSHEGSPAVLTIVANEQGTSAQIVDNHGNTRGQKLYFNKNGERCSFMGQRLSEHRIEEGRIQDLGKPMNEEEKEKNMILIIQVPLKIHKEPIFHVKPFLPVASCMVYPSLYQDQLYAQSYAASSNSFDDDGCEEVKYKKTSCEAKPPQANFSRQRKEKAEVEDAIIKVGASEGKFREINKVSIERDTAYPIRVTLQYYKATSTGMCDDSHVNEILNQLKDARKFGTSIGSLVVGGDSKRPTEHVSVPKYNLPIWWEDFWITYGPLYPQFSSSNSAADILFVNGRFTQSTLQQCQQQMLDILGNSVPKGNVPVSPSKPSWGIVQSRD